AATYRCFSKSPPSGRVRGIAKPIDESNDEPSDEPSDGPDRRADYNSHRTFCWKFGFQANISRLADAPPRSGLVLREVPHWSSVTFSSELGIASVQASREQKGRPDSNMANTSSKLKILYGEGDS